MDETIPSWLQTSIWPEQFMPRYDLPGGPPTVRYAICSTPRSGSTFLALMLRNSGLFGCPLEYFNDDFLPTWRKRAAAEGFDSLIRFIESRRTSANGRFAVKIHRTQLRTALAEIGPELLSDRWRFILLRRRDVLKQALSWTAAAQSGKWMIQLRAKGEAAYERSEIAWRIGQAVRHTASWHQIFAERGLPFLELVYEDIAQDPRGALQAVADFLATPLPPDLDVAGLIETPVQRSARTSVWETRYIAESRAVRVDPDLFEYVEGCRALALQRIRRQARRWLLRLSGTRT
jgi:LPS sulfotransferase NodH